MPLGGVQTYTDFYGLVRTLAAVSTAATIGELTPVVGGVGLVGGICRQYKTLLAPHRRPLDCYRRLRTHPYPVPVGGQTALFEHDKDITFAERSFSHRFCVPIGKSDIGMIGVSPPNCIVRPGCSVT